MDRDLSLALAKTQAHLDLIASRAGILSDLSDLKEVNLLEAECSRTIRELNVAGRVPSDPLAGLESEIARLCTWARDAAALVAESDALRDEVEGIGTSEIRAQILAIRIFVRDLPSRCEALAARCPESCLLGERIDPRISEIWCIRSTGRTKGWERFPEAQPDVASLRQWLNAHSGGMTNADRLNLSARLEERLAVLGRREQASVAEGNELADALLQLGKGHSRAARTLNERVLTERFANPLWQKLAERLQALDEALARVRCTPTPKETLRLVGLIREDPAWAQVEVNSEFGATLAELEKGALNCRSNHRWAVAAGVFVLTLSSGLAKLAHDKDQPLLAYTAGFVFVCVVAWFANKAREKYRRDKKLAILRDCASSKAWLIENIGLELIQIDAGTFQMGSEKEGAEAETGGPQTQVSLRDFLIGKTAVTQAQWRMVMSGNPSHFHEAHHSTFAGNQVSEKDSLPVENVSWEDAVAFCRKLTERVRAAGKLPDGMELTLPTEAQWEYACRAGATGDEVRELGAMAWFSGNSKKRTHPVATKQANAWGLHDMNGNVWEWCLDVWQDRLPGGKVTDPMGPKSGDSRVVRGGSYKSTADWCNYTVRGEEAQGDEARADDIGFRLALSSVR